MRKLDILKTLSKDLNLKISALIKSAGQVDNLASKYPKYKNEILHAAKSLNPAYLKYVVLQLEQGYEIDKILSILEEFKKNQKRLPTKDIFQYYTLDILESELNSLPDTDKSKYKKIYEDDNLLVAIPENKEAAIKLGKGTKLCISSVEADNDFDDMLEVNARIVFFISKNEDPYQNPMAKIAAVFIKLNGNLQKEYRDAKNTLISENDVRAYINNFDQLLNKILDNIDLSEDLSQDKIIQKTTLNEYMQLIQMVNAGQVSRQQLEFINDQLLNSPHTDPRIIKYINEIH